MFLLASIVLVSAACGRDLKVIDKPLELAVTEDQESKGEKGTVVSVERLKHGQEQYTLYCRPCHGDNGDGRGPAGIGLIPPPRDFTSESLAFKFGGVPAGSLPPDDELMRVVKHGLEGTGMLKWEVPDAALRDIIAYIKTFNPVWTEDAPETPVEISKDPYVGKEAEAVAFGRKLYHGKAQCAQCHPSYATQEEIYNAGKELMDNPITSFRPSMFEPEAKMSENFGHKLLPPDFGRHTIKAGSTPTELFRTIASGIGGTAMPMWKGAIPDEEIWAISYYVADIAKKKDKPAYQEMMAALRSAPPFNPPPEAEPGEAPAAEAVTQ